MRLKTLFRYYHKHNPKSIRARYWKRWRKYKALLFLRRKGWAK